MTAFGQLDQKGFTQITFQNSGPQPQFFTSKKVINRALAMSVGKYNVLIFAKHRLYPPALLPKYGWYNCMCTMK